MKNQKSIHEMIDINKLMNDIFPECNEIIEDYIYNRVIELTLDQDLWNETDDIWYEEIYRPILNQYFLSKKS